MAMGLTVMKLFPATVAGGTDMLKALHAVYPVRFMPTGGVKPENAEAFLAIPSVFCCGGTWMVPQEWIDHENWDAIADATRQAAALVQN